jgi:phage shock protein A
MSAKAEIDRQIEAMKGSDAASGGRGRTGGADDAGEWLSIGQGPTGS